MGAMPQQSRLSLMLGAAALLVLVLGAILAQSTPVIDNHVEREIAAQRDQNAMYFYDAGYIDDGDYVLLGQLPNADFSRGGVYFVGPSEMKLTLMPWRLSEEERGLIHNYSIGDFRHSDVREFLRMLTEEAGFLSAGGEQTTIYLGLSTEMANAPSSYVPSLLERYGFYSYDRANRMHIVDMPNWERQLRLARDRGGRFLRIIFTSPTRVRGHRPIEQLPEHQVRAETWFADLRRETQELAATIDYLQRRGVNVRAILPPEGSWRHTVPYPAAYLEAVRPILEARGVPLIDQRALLSDSEFGDAVHARYSGQLKLHDAYLALARQSLAEMGTELAPAER